MTPKNVQMPNPNPKYKPPGTAAGGRGGNKMKCSGKNCPMQYPYDVKSCAILETCPYATLIPYTNAEHIRAFSDEELAHTLVGIEETVVRGIAAMLGFPGEFDFSREEENMRKWLQQPAEEET